MKTYLSFRRSSDFWKRKYV